MQRTVQALYDCETNRWKLGKLGLPLAPVPLIPGDTCNFQVQYLNVHGDLTGFPYPLLWFKTYSDWVNGGNFAFASNVYVDDGFFDLALNRISIPFIVPYTLPRQDYMTGIALFTSTGMTGQKMETAVLRQTIVPAGVTGTETNPPAGTPGTFLFTVTIAAGETSSPPQLITGLTAATGKVIAQPESTAAGFTPWSVTVSNNSFIVTVPQPPDAIIPGAAYKFTCWVAHL